MAILRDFALALAQLTGLPLDVPWPEDRTPQIAAWYPFIGLGLGLVMALTAALVRLIGVPEIAAIAAVVVTGVATRLLHWDGVADVVDAWFAPPERRLDVMKDTRTGAFAAFGVAAALLAYVAAVTPLVRAHSLVPWSLVLLPFFGRLAATFSAWLGKPARTSGLGASVVGRPTVAGFVVGVIGIGVGAGAVLISGVPPWTGGVGIVLALVVPHLVSMRFGGVTGDTIGASVVATEIAMAVVLAATVSR